MSPNKSEVTMVHQPCNDLFKLNTLSPFSFKVMGINTITNTDIAEIEVIGDVDKLAPVFKIELPEPAKSIAVLC